MIADRRSYDVRRVTTVRSVTSEYRACRRRRRRRREIGPGPAVAGAPAGTTPGGARSRAARLVSLLSVTAVESATRSHPARHAGQLYDVSTAAYFARRIIGRATRERDCRVVMFVLCSAPITDRHVAISFRLVPCTVSPCRQALLHLHRPPLHMQPHGTAASYSIACVRQRHSSTAFIGLSRGRHQCC